MASDQVVRLLLEAAGSADALLEELAAERGLSGLHYRVLGALAELGPHGRADLAAPLGAATEEVVWVVDDLLARNLVTRMVVHVGGRQELVVIAEPGRAVLDERRADDEQTATALFAPLTRSELSQLGHLLHRVCATTKAHGHQKRSLEAASCRP